MSLIEKISADLKVAMLARDEFTTTTLRGLKSAILYEEVAKGKRDEGLPDAEVEAVVAREVKKREDAVNIYTGAGDTERADKESKEKEILNVYLPKQLSQACFDYFIDNFSIKFQISRSDLNRNFTG